MNSWMSPEWVVQDVLRVESLIESSVAGSVHPLVGEAALHLLKAGGKRLRPALVMITARASEHGRASTDLAAAAIELVHLATLYHDDVIDGTDTRRGVPTVHARWGTDIAVLAGDYLFACGCGLGARAGGEAPQILADAIAEVCEGQIVETATLNDPHRPVDDYVETIRKKTASLFRAAGELGAVTSGASDATRKSLMTYGENLGLAFQVIDDLIDLVGDPRITGKEPGTDLREGVFTAPVLLACARDAGLARSLAGGERDLQLVLPALRAGGALVEAHALAERFGTAALEALDGLPSGEWQDMLRSIVQGVLGQVERSVLAESKQTEGRG